METRPARVAIYLSKEMINEIDRLNSLLAEKYGLRLDRPTAVRIALQAYCRNVVAASEPYEILNLTDLDNALCGIGKKKTVPKLGVTLPTNASGAKKGRKRKVGSIEV